MSSELSVCCKSCCFVFDLNVDTGDVVIVSKKGFGSKFRVKKQSYL